MNHDSKRSITTMKNIISVIVSLLLCLAGSASAQEHFLEIIKAEQNQKSFARGETIPGVVVNEDKEVKVGRKLNVGDLVSVPKDVRVTFESSNKNTIETKNNAEFIVSNITDKGEAYYQLFGKIRYGVFHKAIEFFKVSHEKYLAAVEGTVFEINVDLENKKIECTAEKGTVAIEDTEVKRKVIISDQEGKTRSVNYTLSPADNPIIQYKKRGNRCEGFYNWIDGGYGGRSIGVVGLIKGEFNFRLEKDEIIEVYSPLIRKKSVNVRAVGIPIGTYYRMDASLSPGETLKWPVGDVIFIERLSDRKIGVYGWIDDNKDFRYVPVATRSQKGKKSMSDNTIRLYICTFLDVNRLKWRIYDLVKGRGNWQKAPKHFYRFNDVILIQLPDKNVTCVEVAAQENNSIIIVRIPVLLKD